MSLLKVKVRLLKVRSGYPPPVGGRGVRVPPLGGSGYSPGGGGPGTPPEGGPGTPPHPQEGVWVPPRGVRVTPPGGSSVPPRGVPCQGGYPAGGGPATLLGGGPTSVVSKLQLSSSGVRWPYIALCPMELWVMLQSIMGVKKKKKKKNYGMVPPHPPWTDRLMDGQTRVKTLPSRRTTYAGGKNTFVKFEP